MKSSNYKFIFLIAWMLVIMIMMLGCGSGDETTQNNNVNKGTTFSVISSGNGKYAIQGNNMDGIAGIELTLNYDTSFLSSPTVVQGELTSDAIMGASTSTPGTIKIAFMTLKAFSGSGQLATISFATSTGEGNVTIAHVIKSDIYGSRIP